MLANSPIQDGDSVSPWQGIMTLRVFMADDEPLALSRLAALLSAMPDVEIVGTARDGNEAAEEIRRLRPDLVFLDVRMPGQGGIALARSLQALPGLELIFVTAFDQFALEAFDVDAVDYLLKPVEANRLSTALIRARRRKAQGVGRDESPQVAPASSGALDGFWLPHRDGSVWVGMNTIDWIEAARDYVLLHTANHSHMLRATMGSLERQIDPATMVRVSRSAFVRRAAVARVVRQGSAGYVVVLRDDTVVRVGTTFVRSVEEAFHRSDEQHGAGASARPRVEA